MFSISCQYLLNRMLSPVKVHLFVGRGDVGLRYANPTYGAFPKLRRLDSRLDPRLRTSGTCVGKDPQGKRRLLRIPKAKTLDPGSSPG